ncbi:MAG: hypothetical protein COB71_09145 [Thiotrichales bacterium]|nr:MAG: hypothetical protein COB71_09145 [Thiotrichales bacterium]
MRNIITALFLSSLLFATPAIAGSGHEHDKDGGHSHAQNTINSEEAATRAAMKVEQLANKGQIDGSWAGLEAASIEQKRYKNGPEWVITFKNGKVRDAAKQTLYLFFSLDGHYIAANYTGN